MWKKNENGIGKMGGGVGRWWRNSYWKFEWILIFAFLYFLNFGKVEFFRFDYHWESFRANAFEMKSSPLAEEVPRSVTGMVMRMGSGREERAHKPLNTQNLQVQNFEPVWWIGPEFGAASVAVSKTTLNPFRNTFKKIPKKKAKN